MIKIDRMLLIGGMEKHSGKTSFSEKIIKNNSENIYAVKITIFRGERNFVKYVIQEETDNTRQKDTSRLLKAGAKRVYWVKTDENQVSEALSELLTLIPDDVPVVCESNSLAKLVKPSLFIMIKRENVSEPKRTAIDVMEFVDKLIETKIDENNVITWTPDLSVDLKFQNGVWTLVSN